MLYVSKLGKICVVCHRIADNTEGAVGPTEILGSKRGACRAESLSQVCDRCRDKRDAQIRATSSAWATPARSLNLV